MDKVIVTTGGTGGHIFPAMAIIEEIHKRNPSSEILFVGGENGQEKEITARAGIPFKGLQVKGFLGKGIKALPAGLGLARSIFSARAIIRDFSPQVIVGCGGYASFPTMLAGLWQKIPCLVHEQNAVAGATNRIVAKLGAKVCVSLPETSGFEKNVSITGNPVRECFFHHSQTKKENLKKLLIIGGSQGAHALNMFICGILPLLKKCNVQLLHQTGKKDYEAVKAEYEKHGLPSGQVREFIYEMDKAYEWADLILCRAGASTIAEICAMGKPSILVPFPAAIHDHQTCNARRLEERGAAKLVPQNELDNEKTGKMIISLLENQQKLAEMADAAKKLARPDAAAQIVNLIEKMAIA